MDDRPNAMLACTETDKAFLLVPRQYETSVEVDDNGDLILRQEDGLGADSTIYIAKANVSLFLERLIDLTPHGRCSYGPGPMKASGDEATVSEQRQPAAPRRRRYDANAAERMRRHRALRKAGANDSA